MKYRVRARGWRYPKDKLPADDQTAIVNVPGEDSNRSRSVAMNTFEKYLRDNRVEFATTYGALGSQVFDVDPINN